MAQHRTLQKQKRMLESGGIGGGGGGSDAVEHSRDGNAAIDPDACGPAASERNLQGSPQRHWSGASQSRGVGDGVESSVRVSAAAGGPGERQPVGSGAAGGGALLLGWQGRSSVAASASVHEGRGSSRGPAVSLHRTYCPDVEGGSSRGSVAGDRGGEDGASPVGASRDQTTGHERWRRQRSLWDDGGKDVDKDEGWVHGSASEGEGGEVAAQGWGGVRDGQAGAGWRGWAGEVRGVQEHRVLRERLQQQRQEFIAEMHSGLYEEQQGELQVEQQQQRQRQEHEQQLGGSRLSEGAEAGARGSAQAHLLAEQHQYHRLDQNGLPRLGGMQSGQRREAGSLARTAEEQEGSLRLKVNRLPTYKV